MPRSQETKQFGKTPRLFVDQHGNRFYCRNIKELRSQVSGRITKMYIDTIDGKTLHIGYVIGQHWLTEYARVEREQ